MHTHTYPQEYTSMTPPKHADQRLLRLTIYTQICIHIHIHMYIHAQVYIYKYACIYIHIYMSVHIHTCSYIHTHVQHVHMHARKHVWNDCAAGTAREARLDAKKFRPSPCPLQSGGGLPFVAGSPIAHGERQISAEQPRPTAAHRTITTARRPDHIRLSALMYATITILCLQCAVCKSGSVTEALLTLSEASLTVSLTHSTDRNWAHH